MAADRMKVGIVVPAYLQGDRLFAIDDKKLNRDDVLMPFYECREKLSERGIHLETCDRSPIESYHAVVFFCHDRRIYLRALFKGMLGRCIYVAWEPPTVDPLHEPRRLQGFRNAFGRILTWNNELLALSGFGSIRYAQSASMWEVERPEFAQRLLIANISGDKTSKHPQELYSERRKILRYFQQVAGDQLAMYGPSWNYAEFSSYRGLAEDKANAYASCRFALCFENMWGTPGYITEKIFDCFRSGVVPVYCGAPDIEKFVPEGSFVAHKRGDHPSFLLEHLRSIDEVGHAAMLEKGRQAIASLDQGPFSPSAMADDLERAVNELEQSQILKISLGYVMQLTLRNLARKLRI